MIFRRLAPHIEGTVSVRSTADEFMQAFERRVQAGLLTGRPNRRSTYRALHLGPGKLHVSAGNLLTAINVGLNQVELQASTPGSVHYRVWYWRWARFVLFLTGTLGVIGLVLILMFDVRSYIADYRASVIPSLSVDQNLQLAWSMILFWGFVFPWLLIVVHKRPLRRRIERLIRDVDHSTPTR